MDLLIVGQFCEIVGPKFDFVFDESGQKVSHDDFTHRLVPEDVTELNNFLVRVLSADQQFKGYEFSQTVACSCHSLMQNALKLRLSQNPRAPPRTYGAFIQYFLVHDISARGYVRNFVFLYLTPELMKIQQYYSPFAEAIEKAVERVQAACKVAFREQVEYVLKAAKIVIAHSQSHGRDVNSHALLSRLGHRELSLLSLEVDALQGVLNKMEMSPCVSENINDENNNNSEPELDLETAIESISVLFKKAHQNIGRVDLDKVCPETEWHETLEDLKALICCFSHTLLQLSLYEEDCRHVPQQCFISNGIAQRRIRSIGETAPAASAKTMLCIGGHALLNLALDDGSLTDDNSNNINNNISFENKPKERFLVKSFAELVGKNASMAVPGGGPMYRTAVLLGYTADHLVATLLRGHPLLILFELRAEEEIQRIMSFLHLFIPGRGCMYLPRTEGKLCHGSAAAYSKRITEIDFARYAFVATTSLEQFRAAERPTGLSILEVSSTSAKFRGQRYRGDILRHALSPDKMWPSDATFLMHIHSALFEFGMKAAVMYQYSLMPEHHVNIGSVSAAAAAANVGNDGAAASPTYHNISRAASQSSIHNMSLGSNDNLVQVGSSSPHNSSQHSRAAVVGVGTAPNSSLVIDPRISVLNSLGNGNGSSNNTTRGVLCKAYPSEFIVGPGGYTFVSGSMAVNGRALMKRNSNAFGLVPADLDIVEKLVDVVVQQCVNYNSDRRSPIVPVLRTEPFFLEEIDSKNFHV